MTESFIKTLEDRFRHKVKTAEELMAIIGRRPRAKKVIMCHGTFDIVHPGHVRHLLYAKTKGDILIASLTCDAHVTKGFSGARPHVPEKLRAINLAAFEMVDYVIIDREATPLTNLAFLQPDYFAKGFEYNAQGMSPKTMDEVKAVERYGGEMIFTPGDVVYSSSTLIEMALPQIHLEKLEILMDSEGITFNSLRESLGACQGVRVHVVGDTIVDSYSYCSMIGGMTKTPTLSVRLESRQDFCGGAGIVAKHLRAAGAQVAFSTVLGKDAMAEFVLDDLKNAGIDCHAIVDETRPTTVKHAFIAGGYRLLKVDTLDNRSISERIVKALSKNLDHTAADIVVFSDFRHGLFNKGTIPPLIAAISTGVFRVADSQVASRWGNILDFQGFDLITPNEREARFSLGDQDSGVRPLAHQIYSRSSCKTLILKLGERGIVSYRADEDTSESQAFFTVDSFADRLIDAVGAGDALLAYASLALKVTGNAVVASILGSFAAAIECEHDGNVPVTLDAMHGKIDAIENEVARWS